MLPGGLCNLAGKGTMTTPDSTYEWRRKGEHVTGHTVSVGEDYRSIEVSPREEMAQLVEHLRAKLGA